MDETRLVGRAGVPSLSHSRLVPPMWLPLVPAAQQHFPTPSARDCRALVMLGTCIQ